MAVPPSKQGGDGERSEAVLPCQAVQCGACEHTPSSAWGSAEARASRGSAAGRSLDAGTGGSHPLPERLPPPDDPVERFETLLVLPGHIHGGGDVEGRETGPVFLFLLRGQIVAIFWNHLLASSVIHRFYRAVVAAGQTRRLFVAGCRVEFRTIPVPNSSQTR
ncbi:hypothetical protein A2264_01135 [candidate division WWE3 bacterium RIFOXYA2_FULL_46_9]|uniref:Uncharacterized protein n=1 Tax=candidate division WWE3 bacterium RIFOXYA2_FULL_46_9 TaxID=1802636 RepID=A0A1F4VZ86_UNCKA|nr:MAG: hypothetical protein A2264_01135 [candidate division WWE3 bacterium RIFOXYA2_FULL_46_9]